jgi:DNA-binding protein WhiA
MSFSGDVKDELVKVLPEARHCQIAEIASVMAISGKYVTDSAGHDEILIRTENPALARKVFTILKKAFNIGVGISAVSSRSPRKSTGCLMTVDDPETVRRISMAVRHQMLLSMECCRRSFLRGAFLSGGSISAPEKYYHLEIVCPTQDSASMVQETMKELNLDAKTVMRKRAYVVYLKEGAQIVDMLGLMGANLSLMNLENIRIIREMRGTVNRKVNCETANLNKTVTASLRQTEDILYIRDHEGLSELSSVLREMAEARIRFPDASLTELGNLMQPKVGKSGVNHRLRKLSEFAEQMRNKRKESTEEGGTHDEKIHSGASEQGD